LETTTDCVEWVRGPYPAAMADTWAQANLEVRHGRSCWYPFGKDCIPERVWERPKYAPRYGITSHDGNSNTVVKTPIPRSLDGLCDTVDETVELLLSSTDIGRERRIQGVVGWVVRRSRGNRLRQDLQTPC
jgi:hypothetical protein